MAQPCGFRKVCRSPEHPTALDSLILRKSLSQTHNFHAQLVLSEHSPFSRVDNKNKKQNKQTVTYIPK